jgi:hypothetical protein
MTRKSVRVLALALLFLAALYQDAIAQVRVRGYFRKNGTYVQPHYRSMPDGNFYNNWSTFGNINPYTGKPGTRRSRPKPRYTASDFVPGYTRSDGKYIRPHYEKRDSSRSLSDLSEYEQAIKAKKAEEPSDEEKRQAVAKRLGRLGITADWTEYMLAELLNMERRYKIAKRLSEMGVEVDWRKEDLGEMHRMEMRKKSANRLALAGVDVDWQTTPLSEMYSLERQQKPKSAPPRQAISSPFDAPTRAKSMSKSFLHQRVDPMSRPNILSRRSYP